MFLFNYPSIFFFATLLIIIFYLILINRKKIPIAILPRTLKITAESNLVGIKHDSDVIIDCECTLDNLECKNLVVTKNGRLKAFNISAENLFIGGELSGASMISIKNIIKVKGKLSVDILSARELFLYKKSSSTVTTLRKETKVHVKSGAFIKGFFQDIDEMVESVRNYCNKNAPDTLEEDDNSITISRYSNVKKFPFKKRDDDESLL